MALGYTLGKAQRLLKNIPAGIGKIYVDTKIAALNQVLINAGVNLPAAEALPEQVSLGVEKLAGSLIITAPFSALNNSLRGRSQVKLAHCSGWMLASETGKNSYWLRGIDKGVAISDHADWPGLNSTVAATGAEKVFVMHGFTKEFAHYLNHQGLEAEAVFSKPYLGRGKKKQLNIDQNQQLNLI